MPKMSKHRKHHSFDQCQFVPDFPNVLVFDSRFENGNLRKAAKVSNNEYNLWLQNDTNTRGHTQWFYFKVIYKEIPMVPESKKHRVKFNILNLTKNASLFSNGMKPCVRSKNRGGGWFRAGELISYSQNEYPRSYDISEAGKKT